MIYDLLLIATPFDENNYNLFYYTDDPSNSVWTFTGTTYSTGEDDPDGGSNGWKIINNDSGASEFAFQSMAFESAVDHAARLAVRSGDTAAVSDQCTLKIRNVTDAGFIDLNNAKLIAGPGSVSGSGTTALTVDNMDDTDWTIIEFTIDAADVDTSDDIILRIFPGDSAATTAAKLDIYRPQVQVSKDGANIWGDYASTPQRLTTDVNGPNGAPGQEITVRLSSQGYRSDSADAVPNVHFPAALTEPYSAKVSAISGGRIVGRAVPAFGEVKFTNPNGDFDWLLGLNWGGRDVTIYRGEKGQPFDTQFSEIFKGKVEGIASDLRGGRLKVRSLDLNMDVAVQENRYWGIGWGLRFDGTDDEVSWGTNFDKDGASDFTVEVLFRTTSAATDFIFGKKYGTGSTSIGWALYVSSGNLLAYVSDGTTQIQVNAGNANDGEWHRASMVWDSTGGSETITLYLDGDTAGATDASALGSLSNAARSLKAGENDNNGDDYTGDATDFRMWSVARTAADIQGDMFRVLTQSEAGLDGYWPCDEGTGSTATDNIASVDGTITGASWIGTGEGGIELAGKPKPLVYGECYGVKPVLVDPKFLVYQLHDGAVSSIDAVRDGGVALTDEGNVADLWATSVTSGYFKTTEASGLFRLGADHASVLECDLKGDATGSYINTAGTIMRRIATRHSAIADPGDIDTTAFTAMETDADYTVGIAMGPKAELRSALLDQLAASVGAWWGFNRARELTVGVLVAPEDESATVSYTANDIAMGGMREVLVPAPTYEQHIGYRRQWTPLKRTDLQGSLTGSALAAAMQLLLEPYRYRRSSTHTINQGADTDIQTTYLDSWAERTDTLIAGVADAQTEADRRQSLYGSARVLYRVTLAENSYTMDIGTIVDVTMDRLGMYTAQNFVVLGWEEEATGSGGRTSYGPITRVNRKGIRLGPAGAPAANVLLLWGARP
jgi:hypothetical protein